MKCFFCGINNVYDRDLNQVILARLNALAELEPELEFFSAANTVTRFLKHTSVWSESSKRCVRATRSLSPLF